MLIVCPSCASQYQIDPATLGPAGRKVRCASCRTSWKVAPPEATAEIEEAAPPASPVDRLETAPAPVAPVATAEASAERVAPEPAPIEEPEVAAGPAVAPPAREIAVEPPAVPEPVEPVTIESRDHAVASREAKTAPHRPRKPARGKKEVAVGRKIGATSRRSTTRWLGVAGALGCCLIVAGLVFGRNPIVAGVPQLAVLYEKAGLPVNLVGLSFQDVTSTMTEVPGAPSILVVEGKIHNKTKGEVSVPEIDVAIRGENGELLYNWTVPPTVARLDGGGDTTFKARLASPPPAGQRVQVTFKSRGRDVKVALN